MRQKVEKLGPAYVARAPQTDEAWNGLLRDEEGWRKLMAEFRAMIEQEKQEQRRHVREMLQEERRKAEEAQQRYLDALINRGLQPPAPWPKEFQRRKEQMQTEDRLNDLERAVKIPP